MGSNVSSGALPIVPLVHIGTGWGTTTTSNPLHFEHSFDNTKVKVIIALCNAGGNNAPYFTLGGGTVGSANYVQMIATLSDNGYILSAGNGVPQGGGTPGALPSKVEVDLTATVGGFYRYDIYGIVDR